jgi:membrane-associated protein
VTPVLTTLAPLLLPGWMDPETLIRAFGPYVLWGVAFVVFAECGLFAVLPGDSLLFTVGLFVAGGAIDHSMVFVCVVLTVCAVAGNVCGYWVGRLIGPPLFKPRTGLVGRVFDPRHVQRTEAFFDRYGNRALVLARFVPVVRTFVTLVAGVGRMEFRRFIGYTAIGGVLWACGVTVAGYYLGSVPLIKNNVDVVLILIVVASLVPMALEWLLQRRRHGAASGSTTG